MKKRKISNKRTKRTKIINKKKRNKKRTKRKYFRNNKKSIKKKNLKGGSFSLDQFKQPTTWTSRLGPEPVVPEVPKYQRRKLVQLKEDEKLENIYTGGVRLDRYDEDNTFIPHLFQFLYNKTKHLVTTLFPNRAPGHPTEEEVKQLALIYLEARAVVELTCIEAEHREILKYYGVEFNEQNKAFLLIERSNSLQGKCFGLGGRRVEIEPEEVRGLWEKGHLEPNGEWTRRGNNYYKDIYIVFPVFGIEIEGNEVKIITNLSFIKILSLEKLFEKIFIVELNKEVPFEIYLIDKNTGSVSTADSYDPWYEEEDPNKQLKIILKEIEAIEGLTEKLSGEITIRTTRKQDERYNEPWICDYELQDPTFTFQMWRVELAEARLPLELSRGQGGQPGRILYSVINVGYSIRPELARTFLADYEASIRYKDYGTEHLPFVVEVERRSKVGENFPPYWKDALEVIRTKIRQGKQFQEVFQRNYMLQELVKIRDMSPDPGLFTLKENGFCYVDMADKFESTTNYHCPLIMLYHAFIPTVKRELLEIVIPKIEGFYNDILEQMIFKIFGEDITITSKNIIWEELSANISIQLSSGEIVIFKVSELSSNPVVFRKGSGKYLPRLHMDYNINKDLIHDTREGIVSKSFQSRINEHERQINYWVNLTRNKTSPDFTLTETESIEKQVSDYEKKFKTHMESSNGNPLYSNSLALCDKRTTSQTNFAQLSEEALTPVDYSYITNEEGFLPVTYDGLPYGCGYFFSSQEVLHSALNYTTDSLAIFPNPEKVFKRGLAKLSLKEMKELAILFGAPKSEVEAAEEINLREYFNPGGNGHKQFLEWEKSQKISSKVVQHWNKYVKKKKREEAAIKIQAFVRGKQSRKKEQDRQIREQDQGGGSLDPYGDVIRESLEIRFIVKITNETGDPLTNEYLGDPQIGQIFTTI